MQAKKLNRPKKMASSQSMKGTKSFKVGETVLFRLDDTANPGLAKVKLIKKNERLSAALPWDIWQVEAIEIVKPSTAKIKSSLKVGGKKELGSRHFVIE